MDKSKPEDFFTSKYFKSSELVNLIKASIAARRSYKIGIKDDQILLPEDEEFTITLSNGMVLSEDMDDDAFKGMTLTADDIVEIIDSLCIPGLYQSGVVGTPLIEQAQPGPKDKENQYKIPIKGSKIYKANMSSLVQVYSDITNNVSCYNCDVGCFNCTGICGGEACKGACHIGCDGGCHKNGEDSCGVNCSEGCMQDCTNHCASCSGCAGSCGNNGCGGGCSSCSGGCSGTCWGSCVGNCAGSCAGAFMFN